MRPIKKGDGGDSDEEGEGGNILDFHESSMMEAYNSRINNDNDDVEAAVMENEYWEKSGDNNGEVNVEKKLWGSPDGWSPPKPDPNWSLKTGKDELEMKYSEVDNPGGWSDYTFCPKYEKNVYVVHHMPAGARVVKDNGYGVSVEGDWEFFYNGWNLEH